jgi:hypothetical protein
MRMPGAKKPAIRGGLKSGRKRRYAGRGNVKRFAPAMCGAIHTAIEKLIQPDSANDAPESVDFCESRGRLQKLRRRPRSLSAVLLIGKEELSSASNLTVWRPPFIALSLLT